MESQDFEKRISHLESKAYDVFERISRLESKAYDVFLLAGQIKRELATQKPMEGKRAV